jgi:hypothetical protein
MKSSWDLLVERGDAPREKLVKWHSLQLMEEQQLCPLTEFSGLQRSYGSSFNRVLSLSKNFGGTANGSRMNEAAQQWSLKSRDSDHESSRRPWV